MVTVRKLNPRVLNAFQAMKNLGISKDKVKHALKKLLILYDKNWYHIEEGNYRLLVDTIFNIEEEEGEELSKKDADDDAMDSSTMMVLYGEGDEIEEDVLETENIVPPSKRMRVNSLSPCLQVSPPPKANAENTRSESNNQNISGSLFHSMSRNKGKDSFSPQIPYNGKTYIRESSSHDGVFKVPRPVENNYKNAIPRLKPMDEPTADGILALGNTVAAVTHPDISKTSEQVSLLLYASKESERETPKKPSNNAIPIPSSNAYSKLEIASSSSGEMKLQLSYNLALRRPDCVLPTSEAVLQLAEERCIKLHNIRKPNFSLKDVMKEVFQACVELVSKPNSSSLETKRGICSAESVETIEASPTSEQNGYVGLASGSLDVTCANDLMNKFPAQGLCARGPSSSVNGPVGHQSNYQQPNWDYDLTFDDPTMHLDV